MNSDIASRMGELDTMECLAVGLVIDPFGGKVRTIKEASEAHGIDPEALKKALKSAKEKLLEGYYSNIEVEDDGW